MGKARGYSLIELLAALALLSTVIAMGYSLYIMSVKGYGRSIDRIETQQNVRLAASYIKRKLLNAAGDEVKIEKRGDGTAALIIGSEYFDLRGTTLRVNHDWPFSSSYNPMAEGITHFQANKDGNRVVVSISGGEEDKDNYFPISFEVFLRR
ncbi:MAG: prepilin-type N-terminal cleavage/methylation domain-containing protein [Clostridiales bacterium]|jgi:prepilin-type N-terminal cleavage/methylation domain-containing protein|nr:prepilin-type N-terminal cleavage/methylation domain-containing protein [Clostridiales bacterium]